MHIFKLTLLVLIPISSFSQIKLTDGDLDFLKDEKSVRIKFTYKNVLVDGLSERDYIIQKMQEHNIKSSAELWKDRWYADRASRFEPRFKKFFTKKSSLAVGDNAKYTIIVETLNINLGYNVAISSSPANIDAYVAIIETSDPSSTMAQFTLTNMEGRESLGSGYDTGFRLQEAYGRAGAELGRLMKKEIKK